MQTLSNFLLTILEMATFKITKKTTVAELKKQFSNEVGGVLRVYEGRSEAADGATLVSLGAKVGELECRASRTVGKFEEAFQSDLNLKVKVYTKDNWVSVLDGITLATVREIPKSATKAKMEEFLAYQRDEKEAEVEDNQNIIDMDKSQVRPLWFKSLTLAGDTDSVALPMHKVGDGYYADDEWFEEQNTIVIATNGCDFRAFGIGDDYDEIMEWLSQNPSYKDVYYADSCSEQFSESKDVEYQDDDIWNWKWDNMDRANVDTLNNEAEWPYPHFRIDLIYNGKVFHSFRLLSKRF